MLQIILNDIVSQAQYLPRALLLTALFLTGGRVFWGRKRGRTVEAPILPLKFLFLFYASYMLVSAVLARQDTEPIRHVLDHLWFRRDADEWNKEILENVLFFIPFTLLYFLAFRPKSPWKTGFLLSAGASCVIELSQLLLRLGDFQVSDLLYNTAGGMIGCAAAVVILRSGVTLKSNGGPGSGGPRINKTERSV